MSRAQVWRWLPLVSFLRRNRINVLHAHKFGSNAWGTIVGRTAGVPVVIAHEHTWSFEGQALRRIVDRELIGRGADAVLAVSRADLRRMTTLEGLDPRKLRYLPNGIPGQGPHGRDVRAELGIPRDAPVVATVGHLRAQKALEVLIEASTLLAPEFPDLRVLVVGSGEEQRALEDRAQDLGLGNTVLFTGKRSDVPDVLASIDVATLCSDFEGSPLSVMEYMAAGRPVVATRVGGIPDLIEDGVHGLLVPRRDPRALAAAIADLLREPARGREMGRRGRERQEREFDIQSLVDRLEDLYIELHRAAVARGARAGRRARPS